MKKLLILASVLVVAAVVYVVFLRGSDSGLSPVQSDRFERDGKQWARFDDAVTGLAFEYRLEPEGFTLLEPNDGGTDADAPVQSLVLMRTSDYEELQRDEGLPREGPASINIQVFNPGPNITPEEWVAQHPDISNFSDATPLSWIQVDGNSSIRYTWDGLYRGETVVLARKGWVYMLTGTYFEEGPMLDDFRELVASLQIQR